MAEGAWTSTSARRGQRRASRSARTATRARPASSTSASAAPATTSTSTTITSVSSRCGRAAPPAAFPIALKVPAILARLHTGLHGHLVLPTEGRTRMYALHLGLSVVHFDSAKRWQQNDSGWNFCDKENAAGSGMQWSLWILLPATSDPITRACPLLDSSSSETYFSGHAISTQVLRQTIPRKNPGSAMSRSPGSDS